MAQTNSENVFHHATNVSFKMIFFFIYSGLHLHTTKNELYLIEICLYPTINHGNLSQNA